MASDKPIFISYASADIDAAQRIAAVLRESGIEARVGDKQGHDLKAEITGSTLFLAIVSAHAGEDSKDGFRHEWEIAAAHMDTLPRGVPFLLPIIIDDTAEYGIATPEAFGGVHWIRQPEGETSPDLIEEVVRLLTIPRGPVYFPPIPPGLSRPPFSMKKKSKAVEKSASSPWLKLVIGGGAAVLLAVLAAVFFQKVPEKTVPPVTEQTEAATSTQNTTAPVAPPLSTEIPRPERFTDEELMAAFKTSRSIREYEDAFNYLSELVGRATSPSLELQFELARVELSHRLAPEAYVGQIQAIVEQQTTQTEGWMPPLAYGMQRDFANQRRAIRAGSGSLHTSFAGAEHHVAIPLTESYMDQGNWALARHYANQAKLALDEQLSPAAVGPLINGRYQAFLQMARNDPNAIITLDQLIQTQTEGTEPFETMLVRTLIYQRQYDRAMDLVEAILAKPSSFDPATVLFYPPFDQLHRHPRFREVMRPYASADQIDHAIDWVSQQ